MNFLSKNVIQYLVYPLVIKLGEFLYQKFIIGKIDNQYKELQKQRTALTKAIQNAETNEDRRLLSITLAQLSRVSNTKQ